LKFLFQFALAVLLAGGSVTASGADLAVLRNGNSIRHERREIVGAVTRLYLSDSSSGYIEIPTDQIERFERDTAPAPVKSQPAASSSVKPLSAAAAVKPLLAPAPMATALTRQGLNQVVSGAGERHQIDPDFINSVIRAESGFHQNAVSKKGAQGLMQLMPGTAARYGVANPYDVAQSIMGGTRYLKDLLQMFNGRIDLALAGYNAGENAVIKHGYTVPPYEETRNYVRLITAKYGKKQVASKSTPSL